MKAEEKQDEMQRRIAACVYAFEGIPTERIAGKNLGEILAGEMRLHGAEPRADGGFGFEFSRGVCQLLAEAYADQFKQSGAINYLELLFQHSDIGPLTITMQRVEGLTPAQKLAQAESQRDALQAKLAEMEKQASEQKPFMYGIMTANGDPHFEEFCVSSDPALLEDVIWEWNNSLADNEPKSRVVALYTRLTPHD